MTETKRKYTKRAGHIKPAAPVNTKEFCQNIINNKDYRRMLVERAKAGVLPSAIESLIWAYAVGKPVQPQEHRYPDGVKLDLANLTNDQLSKKIEELTKEVKEIGSLSLLKESDGRRSSKPSTLN